MNDYRWALRLVARNRIMPTVSDKVLREMRSEGLVKFEAWPSGHWQITEKGRAALMEPDQ